MTNEVPYSSEQITSFVDLLKNELPGHRDNRGKRHPLAFIALLSWIPAPGGVCKMMV